MAFDGGFLHKIVLELNKAVDSRVDKVYQPSKDELVFLLRKKGFAQRVLITARPGSARICFTDEKYENPMSPPMFCMLIRKHLSAAKLISVTQPKLERIAVLTFTSANEMGDVVEIKLIAEFLGNKTNIILVGPEGRIIDSLRRSDPEKNERMILPGAIYQFPERNEKLAPLTVDAHTVADCIGAEKDCNERILLDNIDGFSPLICREVIFRAEKLGSLAASLETVINELKENGTPLLLYKDGEPFDFSYADITHYSDEFEKKTFPDYSALLNAFYSERENTARIKHAAADIIKLVNNLKNRTEKKLSLRLCDLKKCENREKLRIYGELLKANLYRIKPGSAYFEAENYYDNMYIVKIPLDQALSPQKNAAKYFKDYKKTYTAEQKLTALTEKDREELVYFDSVLDSILRSESISDIEEIREELADAGYIKKSAQKRSKKSPPMKFKEYTSDEGYKIFVGRNNRENDYLTTELAGKNDLWFHTKNIPGSHVIVFSGGADVSDITIIKAAALAAQNSKAAGSSNVPVDYTQIKYVKKPSGSKPGMVIYKTNKTVYVTPDKKEKN